MAAGGLALLTQLTPTSGYLTTILPAEVLVGLGIGCVFTPSIGVVTSGVDPRQAGIAAATANTAMQIGSSVGTAVLNTVAVDATRGFDGTPMAALVHGFADRDGRGSHGPGGRRRARHPVPETGTEALLRGRPAMTIELNHTIVHAHDRWAAARDVAAVLGVGEPAAYGPFAVVELDNGVSLDFMEDPARSRPALRVPGERGRVRRDLGPDPRAGVGSSGPTRSRAAPARSTTNDGGRGLYWEGPDGHWLEIITLPYGGRSP